MFLDGFLFSHTYIKCFVEKYDSAPWEKEKQED